MSIKLPAILTAGFLLIFSTVLLAQENESSINGWLISGPVNVQLPVYHDQKNINNQTFTLKNLLDFEPLDISGWHPEDGLQVQWSGNRTLQWETHQNEAVSFTGGEQDVPSMAWAAIYLESSRFAKTSLKFTSHHPFKLYINGDARGIKETSEEAGSEPGSHNEDLELTRGKHLIIVRLLRDPENDADWTLSGTYYSKEAADLRQSLSPVKHLDLETLSNQPQISNLVISADGSLAALRISKPQPPDGTAEDRIEIRETDTGNIYREYTGGMEFSNLQWSPEGRSFSFTETNNGETSLWLSDPDSGSLTRLIKGVSDFGNYRWSPDGSFIIYSVSEKPEDEQESVRLLYDLEERRPGHFTRSFLYKLNVPAGTTQRLTSGIKTTSLHDISPDGSTLLFSRSHTDYSQRPYSLSEFQLLNIETLERDSLFTMAFLGSGKFSQNGNTILFTGGPSVFGDIGINVPEGTVPNDFDMQAYLYELDSEEVTPITTDFKPAVDEVYWGGNSNTIYLLTTDRSYRNLYSYDRAGEEFSKVETEVEVISQVDFSKDGMEAAYYGTDISQPVKAYSLDFGTGRPMLLSDPGTGHFEQVRFGEDKQWTFTNENGTEIDGFVYYPPDFDPDQSYPVIAYYYGGTVPVTRAFGGRYPKELYAANGYIVYVMQPSGATGYGQEFSALHVNDWGTIVADEIIDGVNKFLDDHPYADRERVGAMGASYGGFMTMLLMTRTDMFAAGVSHAGISNIASYWGEGFWGFQYNSVAAAHSFPWNREDIYVGQSPLYSADNVTTPLLFLTGLSDTNVPPGESIQMYTSLKLLGRETAFIGVEGQNHHILDYNKYKEWKESIIAWFEKYLKDEPEWWEHKYGEDGPD